ncbi:hypothetical protein [Roseateles sp.]|uniref:hypothetical protein n=1 Tax=Roseateles sp. TaxID=1971397 RepID=UPI002E0A0678|nr:hypothetical protein [Roseateles sp.]
MNTISVHFARGWHVAKRALKLFTWTTALLSLGGAALAQGAAAPRAAAAPAVTVKLSQWRVGTGDKGQETFTDADKVKPGDVIEYRALYTNGSAKPVRNLIAVLPLPEGFEYLPKSSKPASPKAEVAAKDARYATEPLMRATTGKDGKPTAQDVPYHEYRSVRWVLPELAAGKSLEVKARVRVGTSQPDAEPKAAQAPPGASAAASAAKATAQK